MSDADSNGRGSRGWKARGVPAQKLMAGMRAKREAGREKHEDAVESVASEASAAATSVPAQLSAADVADRMQGLVGLRDMGILTEEEFVAQRGKLLGLEA